MLSGADIHTHTYINVCKRNDFKKPGAHTPGLKNSKAGYLEKYIAILTNIL